MLDFNQAGEQKEITSGSKTVPPDSIVKLRLSVNPPVAGAQSDLHHHLSVSKSNPNNHQLNCTMTVVGGAYDGTFFYEQFVLMSKNTTEKIKTAINISMVTLRAVIDASRGLMPSDNSQSAINARMMHNDYLDLDGMEFPARLDVKKSFCGKYMNNTLALSSPIITPDKPEYAQVMAGGEIISDNPIPEIPQAPGATNQQPPQGWGAGQQQAPPAGQQPLPGAGGQPGGVPGWAKGQQR